MTTNQYANEATFNIQQEDISKNLLRNGSKHGLLQVREGILRGAANLDLVKFFQNLYLCADSGLSNNAVISEEEAKSYVDERVQTFSHTIPEFSPIIHGKAMPVIFRSYKQVIKAVDIRGYVEIYGYQALEKAIRDTVEYMKEQEREAEAIKPEIANKEIDSKERVEETVYDLKSSAIARQEARAQRKEEKKNKLIELEQKSKELLTEGQKHGLLKVTDGILKVKGDLDVVKFFQTLHIFAKPYVSRDANTFDTISDKDAAFYVKERTQPSFNRELHASKLVQGKFVGVTFLTNKNKKVTEIDLTKYISANGHNALLCALRDIQLYAKEQAKGEITEQVAPEVLNECVVEQESFIEMASPSRKVLGEKNSAGYITPVNTPVKLSPIKTPERSASSKPSLAKSLLEAFSNATTGTIINENIDPDMNTPEIVNSTASNVSVSTCFSLEDGEASIAGSCLDFSIES